jgi:hypothetical protein
MFAHMSWVKYWKKKTGHVRGPGSTAVVRNVGFDGAAPPTTLFKTRRRRAVRGKLKYKRSQGLGTIPMFEGIEHHVTEFRGDWRLCRRPSHAQEI